ncbi:hypothetical protein [Cohnella hashimotonis]|uniref:Uncharacterized protein n=1 Tax=Cohnella hashimotonis TaxID=2826895 RepID=A0ABT6TAC1_9BACL|nr:hypothetical protein [Cohnella hashimotonis]MDI4643776.1 hypothetical protein [Cohnella hashimotonis]
MCTVTQAGEKVGAATLILFMSGYGVTDVINAVFDTYRTEIGIQVLIALFSSGAGQLIKDGASTSS